MRGHVDAESLALCAEGLLSRRRSERIRSHVASCPECSAMQARLTEVPALLAQVPPPRLPPGIAARLDAALSTEAARRAAQDPGTAPEHAEPAQHPGTVPAPRAARPWPARPRGPRLHLPVTARVLATAGVLVVAGGVGYAVSQSSNPSSSSSSGSPASATPHGGQGGVAQLAVRHSGTQYHKDMLAEQADNQVNTFSAGVNSPAKASGGLARQAPSSAVTQCVDKVAGARAVQAGEVKLVDQAEYQGQPATVIVVRPAASQPGTVYVAGAGCSAAHADILARVSLPPSG
jgi:hypothetical protein